MYKYKRGVTDKETLKNSSFFLTNNMDVMCSLTSNFSASRIYDGVYIKDRRVLVQNLSEEIEIKNDVYRIINIETQSSNVSSDEYIESVNLDENEIKYNVDMIEYTKKIIFDIESDALIVKYNVDNKSDSNIKFRIFPFITDRELNAVKTSQMLPFSQRKLSNGVIVNLSVHDNRNIYISSDKLNYDKEVEFINNIKHEVINEKCEKRVYIEDLFVPGFFETTVKKNTVKEFNISISTKKISTYSEKISSQYFLNREKNVKLIPEEYKELRDLAIGINELNLKDIEICTFPYAIKLGDLYDKNEMTLEEMLKYMEVLIDYIKAIEGKYVSLQKIKEANDELDYIGKIIKDLDSLQVDNEKYKYNLAKLKLWYIEILNKSVGETTDYLSYDRVIFVKNTVVSILEQKDENKILNNIETAALMFNATKICKYMLNKLLMDYSSIHEMELTLKEFIEENYWVADSKCMKENIDDKYATPNISMLYTLSLSYPCIVGENSIKLLDTIFRNLYTPYGLREKPKSFRNDLIYPKYLAHFIKANLRQNGITRASKKIAYNLVKELIMDINKKVNGGVPYVYESKGTIINDKAYDVLTNAEMMRLYEMLT